MLTQRHRFFDRTCRVLTVAIAIDITVAALPALAAWSTSSNVNNAVAVATNAQTPFGVLRDGSNGSYIVWFDQRNGSGTTGQFYGQRMDGYGNVMWTANGIPLSPLFNTQLGAWGSSEDGAGGAIVAWYVSGGSLLAQKVDGSGILQWNPTGLFVSSSVSSNTGFSMCGDGAGGAIFAWTSGSEIFAQRVAAGGALQWGSGGVAITSGAGASGLCWAVSDGLGGAIVGWNDSRGGDTDVYAQRINGNGVSQWPSDGASVASSPGLNEQLMPSIEGTGGRQFIAPDGSGGAFFTFIHPGSPTVAYVQRLDSFGTKHWGSGGHPLSTALGIQNYPVAVSDGGTGVIVAWEDTRSGNPQIFAQRFGEGGSNSWTADGVLVAPQTGEYPVIVGNGAGGAVIGFTTYEDAANVSAQLMNASGAPGWGAGGILVSNAAGSQWGPFAVEGACGIIAAWKDSRSGTDNDIYAQGVDLNGTLGCPTVSVDQAGAPGVRLEPTFPNPFSPMTSIAYSIGERAHVRLTVHDVRGGLVKTLVNGVQDRGRYSVSWNGSNDLDAHVSSGVYWAVLESDAGPRQAYRMTLVR